MFESLCKVLDGPREFRVDRIALSTGWRGMVGFVQD